MTDRYGSPLATRYASRQMQQLWATDSRAGVWRQLWAALAKLEHELGLPVTADQVAALERAAHEPIDHDRVREVESRTRHDVMAHVHVLGEAAPDAKGVIHLGATSCFVTDNAELILMRRGLRLLAARTRLAIARLASFARTHAALPTLGFTHLQPAQPTTVGKRACLWIQDLLLALEEIELRERSLLLRGAKGTTGTQASYLELFEGDHQRVKQLDRGLAEAFGFPGVYAVTGQTYPRLVDAQVLAALVTLAEATSRMALDVRLLSHLKEVDEPFGKGQVGSSAMPYKRNPMRCERVGSLARHLLAMASGVPHMAANQMLERTLDDSAHRRMAIPECFLAADAILRLVGEVAEGFVVHPRVIERRLAAEVPFLATEGILMAAVGAGGDRQELHERIREHSLAAGERVKDGDGVNDLLERIAGDENFAAARDRLQELCDPARLSGRASAQVLEFLDGPVQDALAGFDPTSVAEEAIQV